MKQQSIINSSVRSFFVSLCAVIGIGVGTIPIIILLAALINATDDDLEVKTHYSPTVIANAEDIRKTVSKSAPVILKVNVGGIIGTDRLNMHTIREQLTESREGILKNNRVLTLIINTLKIKQQRFHYQLIN